MSPPQTAGPLRAQMPGSSSHRPLPRCVVFDLDGTLIDSRPAMLSALAAQLQSEGRAPVPAQALGEALHHGLPAMLERAYALGGEVPAALDARIISVRERYLTEARRSATCFEGAEAPPPPCVGCNGRIAFDSDRTGNSDVFTINPDGSGVQQLTTSPDHDESPDWSPDGTALVFVSRRDDNWEIYRMNANGSGQTRLTATTDWEAKPRWSPDGARIVYYTFFPDVQVWVMNADGSGRTQLTTVPSGASSPSWSPDGSKILFSTFRDGNFEVYVMNADGSGQTNLTNNPAHDDDASWSPDGSKIVFTSDRGSTLARLWMMNSDGTGATLVGNAWHVGGPVWSPDGAKIAFRHVIDRSAEIATINADGTGLMNLGGAAGYDGSPSWQRLQ